MAYFMVPVPPDAVISKRPLLVPGHVMSVATKLAVNAAVGSVIVTWALVVKQSPLSTRTW